MAPFNRQLWAVDKFTPGLQPYPCPRCKTGVIVAETAAWRVVSTSEAAEDLDRDPFQWTGRASGFAACNRNECRETIAVIAEVVQDQDFEPGGGMRHVKLFKPLYMWPAPPMLDVPEKAHANVKAALASAFASYWFDPSSAGSAVRAAVEALLTQKGVPRVGANRRPIPLDGRLRRFAAARPRLGQVHEQLMAVKWLGNVGTHEERALRHEDVLEALEHLSHCFDELFLNRTLNLQRRARAINRRRGRTR